MSIQREYRRHQQAWWVGELSRPYAPYDFDRGPVNLAANTYLYPGEPVLYNSTNNAFEPVESTSLRQAIGIIIYDPGTVQVAATRQTDTNADARVRYADNDYVKVGVLGVFVGQCGEACEYGSKMIWDPTARRWDVDGSPADQYNSFWCVTPIGISNSADDLIEIRVGYGRYH